MKNYEKMWNDLKLKLQGRLKYHQSGAMQSLSEAICGERETKEIIEEMEEIENNSKYDEVK